MTAAPLAPISHPCRLKQRPPDLPQKPTQGIWVFHYSIARNRIVIPRRVTIALNILERITVLLKGGGLAWEGGISPDLRGKSTGLPWGPSLHGKSCTASCLEKFSMSCTTLPFSLMFLLEPTILLNFPIFPNIHVAHKRQRHCWQEDGKGKKGEALQAEWLHLDEEETWGDGWVDPGSRDQDTKLGMTYVSILWQQFPYQVSWFQLG